MEQQSLEHAAGRPNQLFTQFLSLSFSNVLLHFVLPHVLVHELTQPPYQGTPAKRKSSLFTSLLVIFLHAESDLWPSVWTDCLCRLLHWFNNKDPQTYSMRGDIQFSMAEAFKFRTFPTAS